MPEQRLQKCRDSYFCARCGRSHVTMFDVEHPKIMRQAAKNLADAIDRRAADEAYAEVMRQREIAAQRLNRP